MNPARRQPFHTRAATVDFVAGEDFSICNNVTLTLLEAVPELRGDPDLSATDEGVTVVWLK